MCWPTRRCWLPALTVLAALALSVPALCGEMPTRLTDLPALQEANQASAPSLAQAPAQVPTPLPAALTAPDAQTQPAASGPRTPPTPEELGDTMMGRQRYQAAIEAYKQASRSSPDVWNKMGISYQLMFNLADASRCYQASLRLDGKNPRVLNNLGTIYDAQKEYGNAERLYRKALKLEPRSALISKNLGTNLLAQHKYKKGWEAYKAAIEIDPNIFKTSSGPRVQNPASAAERGAMNYYMAKGCVRAGMNDCAIDYLRMALNEGFTNPKKIEADGEFAVLRGIPAFQQLLAEQTRQ
jgi:tetratricopeptide (TPR) repeat protein